MSNADNNNHTELPLTMQAIVAYAPGDYRLEEVDVPKVGEGEDIFMPSILFRVRGAAN